MGKELWKPGNMLYPLPAVMVSLADQEGHPNIITLAWVGTVCTNPPMVSISVRPERYSYPILKETGEFVINLTTRELVYATDYCGVRSGRDVDKFKEMKLTAVPASVVKAPMIGESPVNIECKVRQIMPLGSHDMFLADVVAVHADEKYMDENHKFHLEQAEPIMYSHGSYFVIAAAKETGKVVTVEEHSVIGGLGSAVCDVVAEKAPAKVMKIGVNDTFGESGPAVELIKKYGLDADSIYAKVKEFVK